MSATTAAGFGPRLRLERERRKITLASIAENTKISIGLLQGLEQDDVSRWPSGIFRRAFIRAYADAIGVDPEATTREFLERFPDPGEIEPVLPVASAPAPVPSSFSRTATPLRVRIAEAGAFVRGPLLPDVARRWAAAASDLAVVVALGILLFVALQEFWMPFAVATLGYYVGSIVLLGNTPGVSLFAPPRRND